MTKTVKKKSTKAAAKRPEDLFAEHGIGSESLYLESELTDHESSLLTRRKIDLALAATRLEPYDDVLDVCSRHGKHTIELCRRSFRNVVGLDPSKVSTQVAKKRLLQAGYKGGRFSHGDPRSLRFSEERFDGALLLGHALGAFDKEKDDEEVLKQLFRVLRPQGVLLIEVIDEEWIKGNTPPKSYGYLDERLLFCRERYLADDETRLITRELILDPDNGRVAEEFYAQKLYSFESLRALLDQVGFCDILKHHYVKRSSKQAKAVTLELENRLFITAKKPSKHYLTLKTQKSPLPCHAIFGDRHYEKVLAKNKYILKEDPLPLRRLKEALGALDEFQFTFFENHEHLIQEMTKNRPALVMNLCTEGLFNDDDKKLHLPALLDTLRIPYSGNGPDCIALCHDRSFVTALAKQCKLLVPEELWIDYKPTHIQMPRAFPVVVRPAYGVSLGEKRLAVLVKTVEELTHAIDRFNELFPRMPLIIQEWLPGPEYSVGVFGNRISGLKAFPVIEVIHADYVTDLPDSVTRDYEWLEQASDEKSITCYPSRLSREAQKMLVHNTFVLFQRLGARDFARFDFRKDAKGNLKLVGTEPNPSLYDHERFVHMAKFANISYSELLEKLLSVTIERNKERIF